MIKKNLIIVRNKINNRRNSTINKKSRILKNNIKNKISKKKIRMLAKIIIFNLKILPVVDHNHPDPMAKSHNKEPFFNISIKS